MSLLNIAQQITIYVGFFLLVIGVTGSCINVFIFSSVRTYRTTACTFYFLIHSIDNIAFLIINLLSRIIISGYEIDLTRTSIIWCKVRNYLITSNSLFAFTCSCLTAIDQYLVTSRSVYRRSLSNIKIAHRLAFLLCLLHGVPGLLFFNISSNRCMITNSVHAIYATIYVLGLTCIVPVVIMISFGYLTYRNIHSTRILVDQQSDRQLSKMTLIQSSWSSLPLVLMEFSRLTVWLHRECRKMQIDVYLLCRMYIQHNQMLKYCFLFLQGDFYMYLISSSRFCRAVRDRVFFWKKRNLIRPTQQPAFNRQTAN